MGIVAEGVLISFSFSDIAACADSLAEGIEQLERFEATWVGDDEAKRDFWHAHGELSGVHERLTSWLDAFVEGTAGSRGAGRRAGSGQDPTTA